MKPTSFGKAMLFGAFFGPFALIGCAFAKQPGRWCGGVFIGMFVGIVIWVSITIIGSGNLANQQAEQLQATKTPLEQQAKQEQSIEHGFPTATKASPMHLSEFIPPMHLNELMLIFLAGSLGWFTGHQGSHVANVRFGNAELNPTLASIMAFECGAGILFVLWFAYMKGVVVTLGLVAASFIVRVILTAIQRVSGLTQEAWMISLAGDRPPLTGPFGMLVQERALG